MENLITALECIEGKFRVEGNIKKSNCEIFDSFDEMAKNYKIIGVINIESGISRRYILAEKDGIGSPPAVVRYAIDRATEALRAMRQD